MHNVSALVVIGAVCVQWRLSGVSGTDSAGRRWRGWTLAVVAPSVARQLLEDPPCDATCRAGGRVTSASSSSSSAWPSASKPVFLCKNKYHTFSPGTNCRSFSSKLFPLRACSSASLSGCRTYTASSCNRADLEVCGAMKSYQIAVPKLMASRF